MTHGTRSRPDADSSLRGKPVNDADSRRLADSNCCFLPEGSVSVNGSELERLIAEQQKDMARGHRQPIHRAQVRYDDERDPRLYRHVNFRCGTLTAASYGCRCEKCRPVWQKYDRENKRRRYAEKKAARLFGIWAGTTCG